MKTSFKSYNMKIKSLVKVKEVRKIKIAGFTKKTTKGELSKEPDH